MGEADQRGAMELTIAGALGLGACIIYLLTLVTAGTLPFAMALAGLALPLGVGGLLRRWRGRTLPGSSERLRAQQDAPGPISVGVARLFAFLLDFSLVTTLALSAYQLFRVVHYDATAVLLCEGFQQPASSGLAFFRVHEPCFATRAGVDELSGALATLACALYLLVPAATWGATPGLLLVGRVWVREDSHRVGAVHGVVRALAGLVLAPLQALLTVLLTFNFANRYRNVRTGERFTKATWGLLALARRPRTLADMCCRTEAITRRS